MVSFIQFFYLYYIILQVYTLHYYITHFNQQHIIPYLIKYFKSFGWDSERLYAQILKIIS